jgi:hypothetical protein
MGQIHLSTDLLFIGANSSKHLCLVEMMIVSIKQSQLFNKMGKSFNSKY